MKLGHIEGIVEAALTVVARQLENAEVNVVRDYQQHGHQMYLDQTQMEQVFLNLIINACHAMPEGGTLTVATRYPSSESAAGETVVTVTDTGAGIPHEHLSRVFEPFFTTKGRLGESDVPGTGLGLSVSHGIVTAHGGTITVRSQVGVGTTFEIRLPVSADPGDTVIESEGSATSLLDAAELRGARVLIAEDEEDVLTMLGEAFSASACHTVKVKTAQQALAALKSQDFDLVVSDLMMPGGGGRAILEFTSALDDPPPVTIITGRLEKSLHDEVIALGASHCLKKPFDLNEVLGVARDLVRARCQ